MGRGSNGISIAIKRIVMKKLLIIIAVLFISTDIYAVELLVKRQANYTHADPVKNEAGVAQRGDITAIKPDGWPWGKQEHPMTQDRWAVPRFFIIKIPGVTVAQAQKYTKPRMDDVDPEKIKTNRLWKIEADSLPEWAKTSIKNRGEVSATWNQIRAYIRNKETGLTEE